MGSVSVTFALAFAAGVASFLSPCVLPVVPGILTYVTGVTLDEFASAGGDARRQAAVHAAFFVLGFGLLFVLLGASATALGAVVRRALPLLQQVGGAVVVLLGLSVMGVLRVPLLLRDRRAALNARPAGWLGSAAAGVAFGAGWTPCIGPILATILLYAGTRDTALHGAGLLAVYAVGLGLPFFIAAVAFNWFLARTRWLKPWLVPIERVAGAGMVLAGALLFTGHFSALARFFAR